jgi:phospholipase/carboxylesterase
MAHLLVGLHGVGATAASFESLVRALASAVPRAELLVPSGFHPFDGGGAGRQWFSIRGVTEENRPARVRAAAGEVSAFLDAELARRKLPPERLVLVGFSQGAIVAAHLAVHRRPAPAAVVLLSGRFADDAKPVAGAERTPVPIFLGHGTRDPIMPVALAETSARALSAWGAHVTMRIYPGLAHEVDARELDDAREFLSRALAP